MLHKWLCEVTTQVAAHWCDVDKELLVSAGIGVPRGSLLDGAQTVLLPRGGRGVKLAGSCSSPSDSAALAVLFQLSSAFKASCMRDTSNTAFGMQAQQASSACRGKHISHHLAIVSLEPWTTSLRSTFTTTDHESLRSSLTTSLEAPKNFAVWHVGHHPSPCHSCLSMCPVRQRTLRAAKEKPVSKGERSALLKLQATPAAVIAW